MEHIIPRMDYISAGHYDKVCVLEEWLNQENISWSETAYIGDDINDYEVLQYVGLSAAPPQSPILKHLKVDFITERKSGDGSFRDLAELILDSQKIKII